jgi:hypothetical protein
MSSTSEAHERLLHALAEQLKLPLLQIARQAELAEADTHSSVRYIAEMAMQLIDGYLLNIDVGRQQSLELEPVSISSVLHDTAHKLSRLAREHDCDLNIHLSGKYGPVMAHRQSVEVAFTMLGYSLIESQTVTGERHSLLLAAHRSQKGLVAGFFADESDLTTDAFRRARALYGSARQPLPALSPASSAGIFVADSILSHMSAPLHVARHHKLAGLAATLLPSQQMQLV